MKEPLEDRIIRGTYAKVVMHDRTEGMSINITADYLEGHSYFSLHVRGNSVLIRVAEWNKLKGLIDEMLKEPSKT